MKSNVWVEYEKQKAKLQAKGLSPKEYERELRKIAERLKI